jgi:MYXO-CTERM domain-containing protein
VAGRATVVVTALLVLLPHLSRADGAFPNGQAILVPADRPNEIVLATNFGLVTSADAGRTWLWSCEQAATTYGRLYQMGPAPAHRLFAVAQAKLVFSDDDACGWDVAGGSLGDDLCEDAFVDPSDGTRVLAAGLASPGGIAYTVYESTDGGATFDRALYSSAPGDLVTGVEIAASDPMTIDLALAHGAAAAPTLARSTDGGASWTLVDLTPALGAGQVRIVAIDPTDADRVFLRHIGASGDALAIATNGGATVAVPLSIAGGALAAFTRTSAGTLLAYATGSPSSALFRSTDGGETFGPVAAPPPILALAARGGTIYAATDTTLAPFAEATSRDEGTTWTPGLSFSQVAAIAPCLKSACQTDCQSRVVQKQWPAAICAAAPPVSNPPDASNVPDAAVGLDGGTRDAVVVSPSHDGAIMRIDAGDTPRPSNGCSCTAAPRSGAAPWALALLIWPLLRRRRRRAAVQAGRR